MNKYKFSILFVGVILASLALFTLVIPGIVSAQSKNVEINFTYTKQSGFSSNQFAVWIEDARGNYIKTLYATRFTAAGGWQKRELSLPLWVKQSNLAAMNKAQIDALTGPTPKNGNLRYVWDGTDSAGRPVSAGEYRVILEATLRNENCVVYTAVIKLGEHGTVTPQARYSGSSAAERGMIGQVTVSY